jgi:hypothetical protein
MLSQSAVLAIEKMFCAAANKTLAARDGDTVNAHSSRGLSRRDASATARARPKRSVPTFPVVAVTICTFSLKLVVMFELKDQEATEAFYRPATADAPQDATMPQPSLLERFNEVANLCCGRLNRSLLEAVENVGMSTPSVLCAESLAYVEVLRPTNITEFSIELARPGCRAQVAARILTFAHRPVDWVASLDADQVETGELELL